MPRYATNSGKMNPRGSWAFSFAWLGTVGINLGWRITHGGFPVRIQMWFFILAALLFTLIMAWIGKALATRMNEGDSRQAILQLCKGALIAGFLWPVTFSVATYISVLLWVGPRLFLEAIQTAPFWAIYSAFPKLIAFYVVPSILSGALFLWAMAKYTKGSTRCA